MIVIVTEVIVIKMTENKNPIRAIEKTLEGRLTEEVVETLKGSSDSLDVESAQFLNQHFKDYFGLDRQGTIKEYFKKHKKEILMFGNGLAVATIAGFAWWGIPKLNEYLQNRPQETLVAKVDPASTQEILPPIETYVPTEIPATETEVPSEGIWSNYVRENYKIRVGTGGAVCNLIIEEDYLTTGECPEEFVNQTYVNVSKMRTFSVINKELMRNQEIKLVDLGGEYSILDNTIGFLINEIGQNDFEFQISGPYGEHIVKFTLNGKPLLLGDRNYGGYAELAFSTSSHWKNGPYNPTGYCKSKGYDGAYLFSNRVFGIGCGPSSSLNNSGSVIMEGICKWQYGSRSYFIYYDEDNPFSGSCMYYK